MADLLCLDGGATRSLAGLYTDAGVLVGKGQGGPCNPVAYGVAASVASLVEASRAALQGTQQVHRAAVAVAGGLDPSHRQRIGEVLCTELGLEQVVVSTDIYALLLANAAGRDAVLAIAGTGASVLACNAQGSLLRAGGRGAVFGDEGSAFRIGVEALRAGAHAVDGVGEATALVELLPQAVGLNDFEAMVSWSSNASKQELAGLARAVAKSAASGDAVSKQVLAEQARRLAEVVRAARSRLGLAAESPVLMHGGVFEHCAAYREVFQTALAGAPCGFPEFKGPAAVLMLAARAQTACLDNAWLSIVAPVTAAPLAPTEQRRPGKPLDAMTPLEIVRTMCSSEEEVARALRASERSLARAVAAAAEAISCGGRILYTGAGTSGRLGVLDASECPPTFGVAPERVAGVIAGGDRALRFSVEGAEDDPAAGAADLQALRPGVKDVVVGIAASGTTPYVHGALRAAREAGAVTVFLCCNPRARAEADLVVALDTGPEVLTGSTRLKAGSATKAALNMISTGAMALGGFVREGLMVGMVPRNAKLRERAVRIVQALTGEPEEVCRERLEAASWQIRGALATPSERFDISEEQEPPEH